MKKNKISEVIGNINEKYVNEATSYTGEVKTVRRMGWTKWGAIAACFVLVVSLGVGILMSLPNEDQGMLGIYMEDREPIVATIDKWKGEGFVCTVVDPDIHEFITEGYSVLILFKGDIKVTTLDGSAFQYDDENPNAEDCGLPVGTTVKIYFTDVNYKSNGMAHSLGAQEIIPYSPE